MKRNWHKSENLSIRCKILENFDQNITGENSIHSWIESTLFCKNISWEVRKKIIKVLMGDKYGCLENKRLEDLGI